MGQRRDNGFALMLVLIVLAVGVILGTSYLSSAAIGRVSGHNYVDMCRARYLAESGMQHALYLVREDPETLEGSDATPLGPFSVDETGESYTISAVSAGLPGRYQVTCRAVSGHASQSCQAIVQRGAVINPLAVKQALLVGGGTAFLGGSAHVNGPVHVNGFLYNWAEINGLTTTTGGIQNYGTIHPDPKLVQNPVELPQVDTSRYYHYLYKGQVGTAIILHDHRLGADDDVVDERGDDEADGMVNGDAVTPANPAGVVVVRAMSSRRVCKLKHGFTFHGTLIIEGNLRFVGRNMHLTPVEGFPALITTGTAAVQGDTEVTVNGLVYSPQGLVPRGVTILSRTTINGALVSGEQGFSPLLLGHHTINYDAPKATLVDPTGKNPPLADPTIVLRWDD